MERKIYNFYAGPATLPRPVLEKARDELLDYNGTGMSIMEISHRSKDFDKVMEDAQAMVRELHGLSEEYHVLFLQGGASTQFAMVPMNLWIEGKLPDILDTGTWSQKAIIEANIFGGCNVIASSADKKYSYIPKDYQLNPDASYFHCTSNNTIRGTEMKIFPDTGDVPMVCDMSSDFMSRVLDFERFDLIYAGAQKNLGPAGTTVVIIRDDLVGNHSEKIHTMLRYKTHVDKGSMFNTPPCWTTYICKLSMDYLKEMGGLKAVEKINKRKAKIIYDVIDDSDGFYLGYTAKDSRSLMNVTFNLSTPELESKCAKEALEWNLVGLKGHRSVGGMRASIYNAMPLEGVEVLADFLTTFKESNE
ncbi:MAG: 3-phosphoserine/phosphohydroxythreonine transaminase [Candidatus Thermoplasmatota archaeon]|nr:3-phosphoserine/phosphohydroxythreonine transaminase [Candidatus Thermoplasmatota archaeon]